MSQLEIISSFLKDQCNIVFDMLLDVNPNQKKINVTVPYDSFKKILGTNDDVLDLIEKSVSLLEKNFSIENGYKLVFDKFENPFVYLMFEKC